MRVPRPVLFCVFRKEERDQVMKHAAKWQARCRCPCQWCKEHFRKGAAAVRSFGEELVRAGDHEKVRRAAEEGANHPFDHLYERTGGPLNRAFDRFYEKYVDMWDVMNPMDNFAAGWLSGVAYARKKKKKPKKRGGK